MKALDNFFDILEGSMIFLLGHTVLNEISIEETISFTKKKFKQNKIAKTIGSLA